MKKIFVLFFCLFFITNVSFAVENEILPQWNTIAPLEYSGDLTYINNKTFKKNHPIMNSLCAMSIIGLPISLYSINKSNAIEENNYWVTRQIQFNDEISLCKQITDHDSKIKCYIDVKQNEITKNINREQLLLQKKQMIMTQNALNNINNSINKPRIYTQYGNTTYSY